MDFPRGTRRRAGLRAQAGFTLIEIAIALALLAALLFGVRAVVLAQQAQRQALESDRISRLADAQVRQFAADRGRLPCPDVDGDGVEDCGGAGQHLAHSAGRLPYRTLGMAGGASSPGEMPLRYGVYRRPAADGSADTDLAVLKARFKPTNADGDQYDMIAPNGLDLCRALRTASSNAHPGEPAETHVRYASGARQPVAYAIAAAGASDRDGLNGAFDRLNGAGGTAFEAQDVAHGPDYDDHVIHRGFGDLFLSMRCQVIMTALDATADAVALDEEVADFADSNNDSAKMGLIMNAIGVATGAWGLGTSIAGVASAAEVLATSISLLATAAGTCPIPFWVTCAFIPVYAAAVASAATGVALAATGAVLSGVAVALQVAATIEYGNVYAKTSASQPPSTSDPSDALAALAAKRTAWEQAKAVSDAARSDFDAARTASTTAVSSRDAQETTFKAFLVPKKDSPELDPPTTVAEASRTWVAKNVTAAIFRDVYGESGVKTDAGGQVVYVKDPQDPSRNLLDGSGNPVAERVVSFDGARAAIDAYWKAQSDFRVAGQVGDDPNLAGQVPTIAEAQAALDSATARRTQLRAQVLDRAGRLDAHDRARITEKQKIDLVATRTAERNAAQAAVDACTALDPDCAELATLQQALVVAQAALTAAQNELAAATLQRSGTAALVSPALLAATAAYTDAGSDVGGLCHPTEACGFATQVQAFLDRHDAVGETAFALSVDESEWRTAQRATDAAYGDYRLSACAADGKGYDPSGDSCTNDPPGVVSSSLSSAVVCDPASAQYDAATCAALSAPKPGVVAPAQGSLQILRALGSKGVIR